MIDRETAMELASAAGFGHMLPAEPGLPKTWFGADADKLQRFAAAVAQKAAEAERKKHQADIELWKAEAAKADLWCGRCLSMDHGDGRTVQQIQAEAVAIEREACALLSEGMHEEDRPSDYAYRIRARGTASL